LNKCDFKVTHDVMHLSAISFILAER